MADFAAPVQVGAAPVQVGAALAVLDANRAERTRRLDGAVECERTP
jgi:hypothetical protein